MYRFQPPVIIWFWSVQSGFFSLPYMKNYVLMKYLILIIDLLILPSALLSQNVESDKKVVSDKAYIFIKTYDKILPTIELQQPDVIPGKTSFFEDSTLQVFGKLVNAQGKEEVLVNRIPATLTPDKYFYTNVKLIPGLNELVITILSDKNTVNEVSYPVFYKKPQKNLGVAAFNIGKFYALIMGVSNYVNPSMRNLDRPVKDAMDLYNLLTTRYTFEKENVFLLADPKRNDVISALDKLQSKLTANDNLLIFYAGHGTYDKEANIGFWLPSDASRESRMNWISNSNLTDYLKLIKSKHTLLISDACFSGSIFITRSAYIEMPKPVEKAYELPSKQALTSGTLFEVPDASVFLKYLLDRLNKNEEPFLTAEQLYISIKIAVQNNSDDNTQFGNIQGVGHEGGDFVFVLKR
jgi:hypothetical protein